VLFLKKGKEIVYIVGRQDMMGTDKPDDAGMKDECAEGEMKFLEVVASTGSLPEGQDWNATRLLCKKRFDEVLQLLKSEDDPRSLNFDEDVEFVHNCLDWFNEPPFTLQRIGELLTNPNVYRSRQRFLFAFRKLVANISSLDEGSFDQLVQSGAQAYQEILNRRREEIIDKTEPPPDPQSIPSEPLSNQPSTVSGLDFSNIGDKFLQSTSTNTQQTRKRGHWKAGRLKMNSEDKVKLKHLKGRRRNQERILQKIGHDSKSMEKFGIIVG